MLNKPLQREQLTAPLEKYGNHASNRALYCRTTIMHFPGWVNWMDLHSWAGAGRRQGCGNGEWPSWPETHGKRGGGTSGHAV